MATLTIQRLSDVQLLPSTTKLARTPAQLSLLKEDSSHSDIRAIFKHNESASSSEHSSDSEESASSSYESSDWEVHTLISHVSAFMPFKKETAPINLKNQLTQQYLIGLDKEQLSSTISYDHNYDLYELFYPFNNLQSLLFSLITPYTLNDYKKNKAFGNNDEDDDTECDHQICEAKMNWNDICSVNKIKELITNLLSSCSEHEGIKEDELYLMFSTPSPSEIIEQLRSFVYTSDSVIHCNSIDTKHTLIDLEYYPIYAMFIWIDLGAGHIIIDQNGVHDNHSHIF